VLGFVLLQLLLSQSCILSELEHVTQNAEKQKAKAASGRLANLKILLELAGLRNLERDAEPLLQERLGDEADLPWWPGSSDSRDPSGSSRDADAGDSSSGVDCSDKLRAFLDYCGLQGDGDEGARQPREPRVQFMTMHVSKGKEYSCVVTPAFYEGVLPSDKSEDPEQERNTAYVAVTRAKDRLLITWQVTWRRDEDGNVSSLLDDVVRSAKAGRLPRVDFDEE
jgi:superfamily I DNA/RNA helicase